MKEWQIRKLLEAIKHANCPEDLGLKDLPKPASVAIIPGVKRNFEFNRAAYARGAHKRFIG